MTANVLLKNKLKSEPKVWLVTGVAGFIGSNLLESLLKHDQWVVGLDNFSTGYQSNLDEVQALVTTDQWNRFLFNEGDIRNLNDCQRACQGVDYVLHQAALGSVPRSIEDPIATNENNVDGFLNMLVAARDAKVKRFVYAASSSTYGDHPRLPKVEDKIGRPLSPYALTKFVNELYAEVFGRCYGLITVGLRYFNIFGKRQNKNGAYAAVIPSWVDSLLNNGQVYINGNGETSRDFCYIENAVQANLLAAMTDNSMTTGQVYNIAVNQRTSLNELFDLIRGNISRHFPEAIDMVPTYRDFRKGDVLHSQADISKAKKILGYQPTHTVEEGMRETIDWYVKSNKLL